MSPLKIGYQVKLSAEGAEAWPRWVGLIGIVDATTGPLCRVTWPGEAGIYLHREFVEKV
jgi:hypothetical protein